MGHNLVKFQAIERQNSILVVASKPELLRTASLWISRLDKSAVASTGVKVYRVKYGDARQMAALADQYVHRRRRRGPRIALQSDRAQFRGDQLVDDGSADGGWGKTGNAQRETRRRGPAARVRGPGSGPAEAAAAISTAGTLGPSGRGRRRWRRGGGNVPLPDVRITADVANNSVLIYANEEEYRIIERALTQLDRPKTASRHRRHDRRGHPQ